MLNFFFECRCKWVLTHFCNQHQVAILGTAIFGTWALFFSLGGCSLVISRWLCLLFNTVFLQNPAEWFFLTTLTVPLFCLRCAAGVMENTHCLFQALLNPGERDYYSNPLYELTELAIWPSVHPQSLQLWRGKLWSARVFKLDFMPLTCWYLQ